MDDWRPATKSDSKVSHVWYSNDGDDLWLHHFAITENKHQSKATPGQEHMLSQIVRIENVTELGRDSTCNEVTGLLFPPMQSTTASQQETDSRGESKDEGFPPPQRWQEHMEGDLDQDELLLEFFSVGDHPPT